MARRLRRGRRPAARVPRRSAGAALIQPLWEAEGLPRGDLGEELERLYGGGLGLARPTLVANFVQTLDGVVAIPGVERSNALIADGSEADRFLMAILRALADCVVVGSGTMLASPQGTWRAEKAYPPAADALLALRSRLGKPERPTVAVVTAGGSVDVTHPALAEGAIVLTTERAAPDLAASLPGSEVVAVNAGDAVDPGAAVEALHERGHETILSEGGPTLLGALLAAARVDELFLTVSPVLAGRADDVRLSLIEGLPLLPRVRAGAELRSVRRHGGHLFLRYGLR